MMATDVTITIQVTVTSSEKYAASATDNIHLPGDLIKYVDPKISSFGGIVSILVERAIKEYRERNGE